MNNQAYYHIEMDADFCIAFDDFFKSFLGSGESIRSQVIFRTQNRYFTAPISVLRAGYPDSIFDALFPLIKFKSILKVRLDPIPILKAIVKQNEPSGTAPILPDADDTLRQEDLIPYLDQISSKYQLEFAVHIPLQIPWWDMNIQTANLHEIDTEFESRPIYPQTETATTEAEENE